MVSVEPQMAIFRAFVTFNSAKRKSPPNVLLYLETFLPLRRNGFCNAWDDPYSSQKRARPDSIHRKHPKIRAFWRYVGKLGAFTGCGRVTNAKNGKKGDTKPPHRRERRNLLSYLFPPSLSFPLFLSLFLFRAFFLAFYLPRSLSAFLFPGPPSGAV